MEPFSQYRSSNFFILGLFLYRGRIPRQCQIFPWWGRNDKNAWYSPLDSILLILAVLKNYNTVGDCLGTDNNE
jgi:glycogen debranching enzyme